MQKLLLEKSSKKVLLDLNLTLNLLSSNSRCKLEAERELKLSQNICREYRTLFRRSKFNEKTEMISLQRGQYFTTYRLLSELWGCTVKAARYQLLKWKRTALVDTKIIKTSNGFNFGIVINYNPVFKNAHIRGERESIQESTGEGGNLEFRALISNKEVNKTTYKKIDIKNYHRPYKVKEKVVSFLKDECFGKKVLRKLVKLEFTKPEIEKLYQNYNQGKILDYLLLLKLSQNIKCPKAFLKSALANNFDLKKVQMFKSKIQENIQEKIQRNKNQNTSTNKRKFDKLEALSPYNEDTLRQQKDLQQEKAKSWIEANSVKAEELKSEIVRELAYKNKVFFQEYQKSSKFGLGLVEGILISRVLERDLQEKNTKKMVKHYPITSLLRNLSAKGDKQNEEESERKAEQHSEDSVLKIQQPTEHRDLVQNVEHVEIQIEPNEQNDDLFTTEEVGNLKVRYNQKLVFEIRLLVLLSIYYQSEVKSGVYMRSGEVKKHKQEEEINRQQKHSQKQDKAVLNQVNRNRRVSIAIQINYQKNNQIVLSDRRFQIQVVRKLQTVVGNQKWLAYERPVFAVRKNLTFFYYLNTVFIVSENKRALSLYREEILVLIGIFKVVPKHWFTKLNKYFDIPQNLIISNTNTAIRQGFLELNEDTCDLSYYYLPKKGYDRVRDIVPLYYDWKAWKANTSRTDTIHQNHHRIVFYFLLDWLKKYKDGEEKGYEKYNLEEVLTDYDRDKCRFDFKYEKFDIKLSPDCIIRPGKGETHTLVCLEADTGTVRSKVNFGKILKYLMYANMNFDYSSVKKIKLYFSFQSRGRQDLLFKSDKDNKNVGLIYECFNQGVNCKFLAEKIGAELSISKILEIFKDNLVEIYVGQERSGLDNYTKVDMYNNILSACEDIRRYGLVKEYQGEYWD